MPSLKPKRRRRTPDEARALILEAAERVFATRLPDVVGLKDVAREAGVSHALVTHYFGTYEALVEATLERRFQALREGLVRDLLRSEGLPEGASAILATYRRAVARAADDPATVRLAVWAVLSGRAAATDFFSHRMQGLKLLTDAVAARAAVPRADLEYCLVASFALALVWRFGGTALAGALGKKRRELDADFERRTAELFDAYLTRPGRRKPAR